MFLGAIIFWLKSMFTRPPLDISKMIASIIYKDDWPYGVTSMLTLWEIFSFCPVFGLILAVLEVRITEFIPILIEVGYIDIYYVYYNNWMKVAS